MTSTTRNRSKGSAPPESGGLCPDWVVLIPGSNVHACRDRGWFTDYTPFRCVAQTGMNLAGPEHHLQVEGVGTVELPVERSPAGEYTILRLTDVLHIPKSVCNMIGTPILKLYPRMAYGRGTDGGMIDAQGNKGFYFDPQAKMCQPKLREALIDLPLGPSAMKGDAVYMLSLCWPAAERQRWEAFQSQGRAAPGVAAAPDVAAAPGVAAGSTSSQGAGYTKKEKRWLKTHYDGEFGFLAQHGLSIYKDEDREEGRQISRALMAKA